jgi:hypothetical protein
MITDAEAAGNLAGDGPPLGPPHDWSLKRKLAFGAAMLLLSTLLDAVGIWTAILDSGNYTGPRRDHTALSFVWIPATVLGAVTFLGMVLILRPGWTRSPTVLVAYTTTASCVYLALFYAVLVRAVERAELPALLQSRTVWPLLGFAFMGVLFLWGTTCYAAWEQRKWEKRKALRRSRPPESP